MKKLLLSSIIMFGVCSFVTAQNATGSKLGKTRTTTSSATATPQKSAVEATPALTTNPDARSASDRTNAPAAVAPTGKAVRAVKAADATTAISADGTVTATDDVQKKPVAPAKKN